ncbi:MAG: FKBP-type peptidyl-prolyl cis-trans isomerase [Halobacteriales archaeon]|nr:FKBP-type peptidyl-prolyl cis-trans isomerase [Halobacteriales archaeon]
MNDLALRVAALAVFLGVLGGSFYAAEKAFGHAPGPGGVPGSGGGIALAAAEPALSAAPGTQVTFPVTVRNAGTDDAQVQLSAPRATVTPANLALRSGEAKGAWVTVSVPGDAPLGAQRVPVVASANGRNVTVALSLTVLGPGPGAAIGDTVQADYVGRFDNGTLFDTSVQGVGEAPFDKPAGFTKPQWAPLRLQLGDSAGTITGFWRGMLGMQQGQTRSLHLDPADAYGNATQRLDVPRTQEVPRLSQVFQRVQHVPRAALQAYINGSSQVGDAIHVPDPQGNNRTYRIEELDAANATLRWQVGVGDGFTVYPAWPGQSRAAVVTNDTAQFRTEPLDRNQSLTWYPFWPNATRVTAMNDTTILLTHSPQVGATFALPNRSGPASRATIAEVTPTTIAVEAPNEHPLAGKALNFDVTVRTLTKAS